MEELALGKTSSLITTRDAVSILSLGGNRTANLGRVGAVISARQCDAVLEPRFNYRSTPVYIDMTSWCTGSLSSPARSLYLLTVVVMLSCCQNMMVTNSRGVVTLNSFRWVTWEERAVNTPVTYYLWAHVLQSKWLIYTWSLLCGPQCHVIHWLIMKETALQRYLNKYSSKRSHILRVWFNDENGSLMFS